MRQQILDSNVFRHCTDSRKSKLKEVSRTRWVDRIQGSDTFEEIFVPIIFTLEEMSINLDGKCNRDTSSKAASLLKLVTSFDFIVALVITRCVFDLTLPVTQLFQSKNNDIADGLHLIESQKNLSPSIRNSVHTFYAK